MFDEKYFDGHLRRGKPTPILPPGRWDWKSSDNDLANWENFKKHIGVLALLKDEEEEPIGWELIGNSPSRVDYTGPSAYFEGSTGMDVVNLGAHGKLNGFSGGLGGGPDILVFNESWSTDFSTSSAKSDPEDDDDVVVAGCDNNFDSSYDIQTTSIHTGAGRDVLFVRDAERSAFDAGNFDSKTSELDPADGDDVVVLHGNMLDFRVFGGGGNDTAVWYVDEGRQSTAWLGPNFFGGGGSGGAVWGDTGVDRLVLVIPSDTTIISHGATEPGQLLVGLLHDYEESIQWDGPTSDDPNARYCVTCGVGPEGKKTMTMEYRSRDNKIHTGYFWVTAFEELQIGLGPKAAVYELDDILGEATLNPALTPFEPPALDPAYCQGK